MKKLLLSLIFLSGLSVQAEDAKNNIVVDGYWSCKGTRLDMNGNSKAGIGVKGHDIGVRRERHLWDEFRIIGTGPFEYNIFHLSDGTFHVVSVKFFGRDYLKTPRYPYLERNSRVFKMINNLENSNGSSALSKDLIGDINEHGYSFGLDKKAALTEVSDSLGRKGYLEIHEIKEGSNKPWSKTLQFVQRHYSTNAHSHGMQILEMNDFDLENPEYPTLYGNYRSDCISESFPYL